MTVLQAAALLCTLFGLVSAAAVTACGRPTLALKALLDFLLAAGLLRLAGEPGWRQIAAAAALIAVRRLIGLGIRQSVQPPRWPRSSSRRRATPPATG